MKVLESKTTYEPAQSCEINLPAWSNAFVKRSPTWHLQQPSLASYEVSSVFNIFFFNLRIYKRASPYSRQAFYRKFQSGEGVGEGDGKDESGEGHVKSTFGPAWAIPYLTGNNKNVNPVLILFPFCCIFLLIFSVCNCCRGNGESHFSSTKFTWHVAL